ncbi:MAG: hypothetical protein F4139_02800 [Gemmatimonadetes bacterium]|nr:hypothetical protein [Gemmatimonadota bacterium]MYA63896.1 hypothetical protein [Gemmatimonadota bacterium]MYB99988.1 hypothetical protein [Gemmatimonadota bacterium]MYH51861.1 hypothetical protein [Gemmatimonadota bacterium]MYI45876.1 hypothetical protein [Gemmatimonadota bacterium]
MNFGRAEDHGPGTSERPVAATADLAGWLREHSAPIAERWAEGLLAARNSWSRAGESLVNAFCRGLVSFLPGMLSPYRAQILPLWSECAELYGSVAARRGLSAGEVIEEFQILREVIVRLMFERPLAADGALRMRDVLQLNRAVDIGVTQASVGHTDLLFFNLVDGSGGPAPLGPSDMDEVVNQIGTLREEGGRIMRHTPRIGRE